MEIYNIKENIEYIITNTNNMKMAYSKIKKNKELYNSILEFTNEYCPKSFPEMIYIIRNDINPLCKNGKKYNFVDGYKGFRYCGTSSTCECFKENHSNKISKSYVSKSKNDIENIKNKRKETNLEKYKTEHVLQNSDIKRKVRNTNLEKYGVPSSLQDENTKNKIRITLLEKYGTEHVLQNSDIKRKVRNTNLEKYGVTAYIQKEEVKNKLQNKKQLLGINSFSTLSLSPKAYELFFDDNLLKEEYKLKTIKEIANEYDTTIDTIKKWLVSKNLYKEKRTIIEDKIYKFLKNYDINFHERTKKIISPYELDFYFPDQNKAIEVCGLYWHSELINKDKNYHKMKKELCENKNIDLITIFSDELDTKQEIVFNRIKNFLNLEKSYCYARQCEIKEISKKEYSNFLEKFHIQQSCNSYVKLGLYYKKELVSVMGFGKKRVIMGEKNNSLNDWELLRFASYKHIPGAASKLFKYFINKYNPETIISYCDLRWGTGKLYEKLGMNFVKDTKPNYWYTKDFITREYRYKFAKHKLVESGYDKKKSEHEIMQELGYSRIWDCGSRKFIYKNNLINNIK